MIASRQVEVPFYRGVCRQRGRGFGALAQAIGRTAILFLHKYIVPKCASADWLKYAARKIAEVVGGRKNFKTAAKSVGRQTLRKQLSSGSRKRTASRVIPTKSAKTHQSVLKGHFYKHSSLIMSSNIRYQSFVAVSGNLGGKVTVVEDVLS